MHPQYSPNDSLYKEIPLGGNRGVDRFSTVDVTDFDWLSQHSWSSTPGNKTYYARGRVNGKNMLMHQLILLAPKGFEVDHRDGNGLNNTRNNLRLATHAQNLSNVGKQEGNWTSRYKGVYKEPNFGRTWIAQINDDGRRIHLGSYPTESAAAIAYNEAALKYHGEFAHLNEISDQTLMEDVPSYFRVYSSTYIGVHWQQRRSKWTAVVSTDGKAIYIGDFADELEAALARDAVAKTLGNPRVKLNFP